MDFTPPRRSRAAPENIVPMINVVFLLLIFFLMSAQITTPPPVEITPPGSTAEVAPEARDALYLSADGTLYFAGLSGEAAITALHAAGLTHLRLQADRAAQAQRLAQVLADLRGSGLTEIDLVTGTP